MLHINCNIHVTYDLLLVLMLEFFGTLIKFFSYCISYTVYGYLDRKWFGISWEYQWPECAILAFLWCETRDSLI